LDKLNPVPLFTGIYFESFCYYMKFILQIVFCHEEELVNFNSKQQAPSKKIVVEKNMRFSFKEKESFLSENESTKLNFKHLLEEILSGIIEKNISFSMLLGKPILSFLSDLQSKLA